MPDDAGGPLGGPRVVAVYHRFVGWVVGLVEPAGPLEDVDPASQGRDELRVFAGQFRGWSVLPHAEPVLPRDQ